MAVERFKLETHDIEVPGLEEPIRPYWIHVAVYDTDRELHRAMAKHDKVPVASIEPSVGGCFSYPENSGRNNYLGILRLTRENLTLDTIVHESVHVAAQFARAHYGADPLELHAGGDGEAEELVAYVTGPLSAALIEKLILDGEEEDAA